MDVFFVFFVLRIKITMHLKFLTIKQTVKIILQDFLQVSRKVRKPKSSIDFTIFGPWKQAKEPLLVPCRLPNLLCSKGKIAERQPITS